MSKIENSDKINIEKNIEEKTVNENSDSIKDQYTNYNAEWSNQHEEILVEWADKAICYRWLHSQSHTSYSFTPLKI